MRRRGKVTFQECRGGRGGRGGRGRRGRVESDEGLIKDQIFGLKSANREEERRQERRERKQYMRNR
jgi:hypothetical protein